jgi:hypothetical protein
VKRVRIVLGALLSIGFLFGWATLHPLPTDAECQNPCSQSTSWSEFNGFALKVTSPDMPGCSLWHGHFDKASFDAQIDGEISEGDVTRTGKLLLVGGRVLAIQGGLATPGYEIDALDAPFLQYQLAIRLLGAVLPNGAAALRGARAIDFSNERTGIQFATISAQGFIPRPWNAKGTVKEDGSAVEFDLALTAGVEGKPAGQGGRVRYKLSGRLSKVASARLDDSTALDGLEAFLARPPNEE